MFCPYCAWGGEFLGLASLWSNNNRWLGSWQPLRHVAWFIAPSTLAKERLPQLASVSSVFPAFTVKWIFPFQSIIIIFQKHKSLQPLIPLFQKDVWVFWRNENFMKNFPIIVRESWKNWGVILSKFCGILENIS